MFEKMRARAEKDGDISEPCSRARPWQSKRRSALSTRPAFYHLEGSNNVILLTA